MSEHANDVKKNKSNKFVVGMIIACGVVLFKCFILDVIGRENILRCFHTKYKEITPYLCMIMPDETKSIVDAFETIWGLAITVAIFIFEIGGTYVYGVTLRRIINIQFGKIKLSILVGGYLMLYPLAYLCVEVDFKLVALWCFGIAFGGLIVLLWYAFTQTRAPQIRELLERKTQEILIEKCKSQLKDESNLKTSEKSESSSDVQRRSIQSHIDSLAVTDMLEHVDYTNAEETRNLINILKKLLSNKELLECLKNQFFEHTLLMSWVTRIVMKSGIGTEYERQRTIGILKELLDMDMDVKIDDEINIKKSFSVQTLLPFIDLDDENATKALIRIWKLCGRYDPEILVYLLLYTEYRYWVFEPAISQWIWNDDEEIRQSLRLLMNGRIYWDKQFAWKCWMDWTQYDYRRENILIQQFGKFAKDVENIKKNSQYCPESKIFLMIKGVVR